MTASEQVKSMNQPHAFIDSGIKAGNTNIPLCEVCGSSERRALHHRLPAPKPVEPAPKETVQLCENEDCDSNHICFQLKGHSGSCFREPAPKEGDKCEWCGEVDAAHPVMEGVNGHVLRECLTFEPAQVESRDGLLPPLTGISGDLPLKVSTVLHCLTQRERQLLASLQREKDLKGLLTEILGHLMIIADTHYEEDLCVQIKAAVTGE